MSHLGLQRIYRSVRVFTREFFAPPPPKPRKKLGVALGGGFARGMAHLGVLSVLEQEGIQVDFIGGTSVGSIVGAGICSGKSIAEMADYACRARFSHFARWTFSRYGLCSNDRMEQFLGPMIPCSTFEELKIPLAVAATDFITGEPVVFSTGKLIDALRASCAYPGMFLPVTINGRMLIDGMLGYAVPTTPLREMGAEVVIGVHLAPNWVRTGGPRHVFDVIGQCFSIAQDRLSPAWRKDASLVVEPNVDGFAYDCFDRARDLMRSGEEAMRQALPQLRVLLGIEEPKLAPAAVLQLPAKPVAGVAPSPFSTDAAA